ncbi:hypothetical protein AU15_02835 [Marinobacter salarius]|uniref:Uncharacterized protein n=1 Tax=Marinobacter salarius TaxID=1420917 RepID=W5Z3D0_9GAMM|nr:hypothetical protein AU15_02835 [Marinobacter salarius]
MILKTATSPIAGSRCCWLREFRVLAKRQALAQMNHDELEKQIFRSRLKRDLSW